jgi:hypothetical protein
VYNYALGNPTGMTDPTGMAPMDIIFEGANGNTVTIETAGEERTFELGFSLPKSATFSPKSLENVEAENLAVGVQGGVNMGVSMGISLEATEDRPFMSFPGSRGEMSLFSGTEIKFGRATETNASVEAGLTAVVARPLTQKNGPGSFADGYTTQGVTLSGNQILMGQDIAFQLSQSRLWRVLEFEISGSMGAEPVPASVGMFRGEGSATYEKGVDIAPFQ